MNHDRSEPKIARAGVECDGWARNRSNATTRKGRRKAKKKLSRNRRIHDKHVVASQSE